MRRLWLVSVGAGGTDWTHPLQTTVLFAMGDPPVGHRIGIPLGMIEADVAATAFSLHFVRATLRPSPSRLHGLRSLKDGFFFFLIK